MRDSTEELVEFLYSIDGEKLSPFKNILKISSEEIRDNIKEARDYLSESEEEEIDKWKEDSPPGTGGLEEHLGLVLAIQKELRWRASKLSNTEPSYKEILEMTAEKLGISSSGSVQELEIRITQEVFGKMLEKMTPEQKEKLEEKLNEAAKKMRGKADKVLTSGGLLAALGAAHLSGFGVYLLATTTLAGIGSAIGVVFPFAAYATLTSTISVVIGPIGWIVGGLFALWGLLSPNFKLVVPAIVYITALREEKNEEKRRREVKLKLMYITSGAAAGVVTTATILVLKISGIGDALWPWSLFLIPVFSALGFTGMLAFQRLTPLRMKN